MSLNKIIKRDASATDNRISNSVLDQNNHLKGKKHTAAIVTKNKKIINK